MSCTARRAAGCLYPIIALVGYTNAGKSTLFNRLTRAEVYAKDQLFATLDPTMRAIDLPSGRPAILSDTVGFVSDLPHELVAAFRATLEEVLEADIIVHVRDVSHPDAEAQKDDVEGVLRNELDLGELLDRHQIVEVLNKTDLLDADDHDIVMARARRMDNAVAVSAMTGEGCEPLLALLDDRLTLSWEEITVSLSPADGATLAWIYAHGEVAARTDEAEAITVTARLSPEDVGRLRRKLGQE